MNRMVALLGSSSGLGVRAVADEGHHHKTARVDVPPEFKGGQLPARDAIPANLGGVMEGCWFALLAVGARPALAQTGTGHLH